jgi:threonine dehydratase
VIGIEDVYAAREAIGGRLHRTPTFTSATLDRLTGGRVHLKAELFQRTGSFKPRGVLTKLASLAPAEKERGVIGISAGNHAAALAYGAALEKIDCLVVMWQGASELKIAAARGYGAEIDLEATGPGEAFDRLSELLIETKRTLVHPFDDPLTIAGQGTVGLELLEDVPDANLVLVPVGGGGLISGVATAVKGLSDSVRVIGIEPDGADSLRQGLEAGRQVRIDPHTIADGLAAPFAGARVLEICRERVDGVTTVTDDEIAEGMRFLYGRAKLACEPAGAAAVAALLARKVQAAPDASVVCVVSGGNVAGETAAAILAAQ